jgi:phosphatidylserine decarboxylase
MRLEILASSLALALVLLSLLAWKWRISIKIVAVAAIFIGGLAGLAVNFIDSVFGGFNMAVLLPIEAAVILMMSFLVVIARFYRDPERYPAETGNVIISPADGKVIYVNSVENGSTLVSTKGKRTFRLDEIMASDSFGDVAYLVGIDMNLLNVHVNRSPIAGRTVLRKRIKGDFISLRKPESEIVNERVTTIIANGKFSVGVIQIASRLVRRIVGFVREGDRLELGQRIGAIVLGSQVDIVIPDLKNLKIDVKPGDKVKAGVSIIARYSGD